MPPGYALMMALAEATKLAFVFAFGACVGSLMNVLVYRLPRGLDIVTPPSRCPICDTKLTWRENIPIFGWIMLGGRCRFCKARISPEYPIVEASIALLFSLFYILWYMLPPEWGVVRWTRPEWAMNGLLTTWPTFTVILTLVSCLAAMTLIDAKTRMIPLGLLWFPAIVALLVHPLHAWVLETRGIEWRRLASHADWAIPTPGAFGWWWIGAALGGSVGLLAGNLLLWTGLIKRSFLDYDEWEKRALAEAHAVEGADAAREAQASPAKDDAEAQAELWIQYPHARREMVREMAFLAPAATLALVGGNLAQRLAGPWKFDPIREISTASVSAPLWLNVLAGVLLGYLIAGGVVWAARILGTLAFGKEAIGLGDVHLMAGVGACLGWIDPVLGFFAAAFIGVFYEIARAIFARRVRRTLPFGPCLAMGTLVVVLGKPVFEALLGLLIHRPVDLP